MNSDRPTVTLISHYTTNPPPISLAVCRRSDCLAAGRAAPEGLRPGLWYLSLHCNQHLRDNCVEGLQPHHCQHRQRYGLWE